MTLRDFFSSITFLRFLSSFSVILLARSFSTDTYISIFFGLVISHFVVGFYYSKEKAKLLSSNFRSFLPSLLVLIGLAYLIVYYSDPISYTGISMVLPAVSSHFAFTEAYIFQNQMRTFPRTRESLIGFLRVVVNMFAFGIMLRVYWPMNRIDYHWLIVVMMSLFLTNILLTLPYSKNPQISKKDRFDLLSADINVVLLAFISLYFKFSVTDVAFYHIVFWFYYPLTKANLASQRKQITSYLAWTFLIALVTFSFTPTAGFPWKLDKDVLSYFRIVGASFHISSSFALSEMNPHWIRYIFQVVKLK